MSRALALLFVTKGRWYCSLPKVNRASRRRWCRGRHQCRRSSMWCRRRGQRASGRVFFDLGAAHKLPATQRTRHSRLFDLGYRVSRCEIVNLDVRLEDAEANCASGRKHGNVVGGRSSIDRSRGRARARCGGCGGSTSRGRRGWGCCRRGGRCSRSGGRTGRARKLVDRWRQGRCIQEGW